MDGGFPTVSRSLQDLESEITELTGHLNAATHRWLTLVAEFDDRKGWGGAGVQSCAHWLNWKCGIEMGAAREKVRVAHALESLPRISVGNGQGKLSYAKVRALTRVACGRNGRVPARRSLCMAQQIMSRRSCVISVEPRKRKSCPGK